jgi:hypothetical protein
MVHTEEEFDWSKPFDRAETSVTNLDGLGRGQEIFARHGAKPTYMVDYPIASRDEAIRAIHSVTTGTEATIGAHLHPWVNPPFDEVISAYNSFPGNLPRALEQEKLTRLADRITAAWGKRPRQYLAGRHGCGVNTISILQQLEFEIDVSVVAMTEYRDEGGPDFREYENFCWWDGDGGRPILRIPHSVGDVGFLCRDARRSFAVDGHPLLRRLHFAGALSRFGAMTRIRLSPEGFDSHQLEACTRALVAAGVRVLVFSFHSPSLVPGFTPYVRDRIDLDAFLKRIDEYFRFFRQTIGGLFATPDEVLEWARKAAPVGSIVSRTLTTGSSRNG